MGPSCKLSKEVLAAHTERPAHYVCSLCPAFSDYNRTHSAPVRTMSGQTVAVPWAQRGCNQRFACLRQTQPLAMQGRMRVRQTVQHCHPNPATLPDRLLCSIPRMVFSHGANNLQRDSQFPSYEGFIDLDMFGHSLFSPKLQQQLTEHPLSQTL